MAMIMTQHTPCGTDLHDTFPRGLTADYHGILLKQACPAGNTGFGG
jgi:hypothetical protein